MTSSLRSSWATASGLALVLAALAGCDKTQQAAAPAASGAASATTGAASATTGAAPSTPVATVNGTPIPRKDYDVYLQSMLQGKPVSESTPEQKAQVLDELINLQLISSQGTKDGVDKDPEVAARLDILRMRVLADAESQKFLKDKQPTDAELHAEYDAAVAALDKTEYHARHILVPTKEKADQLIKKIKGGAKFEDVAKADSTDGSKANGGDLGWFTAGRMVKPFSDAVKGLQKGQMTQEPVQTQFGWHIIRLEDIREVAPPPFDQVKAQLANRVMQKKLQAYIEDLKKNAKIEKSL